MPNAATAERTCASTPTPGGIDGESGNGWNGKGGKGGSSGTSTGDGGGGLGVGGGGGSGFGDGESGDGGGEHGGGGDGGGTIGGGEAMRQEPSLTVAVESKFGAPGNMQPGDAKRHVDRLNVVTSEAKVVAWLSEQLTMS